MLTRSWPTRGHRRRERVTGNDAQASPTAARRRQEARQRPGVCATVSAPDMRISRPRHPRQDRKEELRPPRRISMTRAPEQLPNRYRKLSVIDLHRARLQSCCTPSLGVVTTQRCHNHIATTAQPPVNHATGHAYRPACLCETALPRNPSALLFQSRAPKLGAAVRRLRSRWRNLLTGCEIRGPNQALSGARALSRNRAHGSCLSAADGVAGRRETPAPGCVAHPPDLGKVIDAHQFCIRLAGPSPPSRPYRPRSHSPGCAPAGYRVAVHADRWRDAATPLAIVGPAAPDDRVVADHAHGDIHHTRTHPGRNRRPCTARGGQSGG